MKKRILQCLAVLSGVILLSGCTAASMLGSSSSNKEASLTSSSYGAADMLLQQSRAWIGPQTPLQIGTLTDMNDPSSTTAFGQVVPGQIAARFVQIGYNVVSSNGMPAGPGMMPPPEGPVDLTQSAYVPPPPMPTGGGNPVMITGQYAVGGDQVWVNLRLVDPQAGRIVAAFDYGVPLTWDVKELTRHPGESKSLFSF